VSKVDGTEALRHEIVTYLTAHGADLVGFAPVSRWEEYQEVRPDFWPTAIFPAARTVIVFGMGMPLPVVETTPSAIHMELYNTVNRELDGLGYHLGRYLNRKGIPAFSFPRDGYGSIKVIKDKPMAAFHHVNAAKYAGLGTIGVNNVLLTPQFGPRVRWISVLAGVDLRPDPMMENELCIRCLACVRCCPVDAIVPRDDRFKPDFRNMPCIQRAEDLTRRRCYPCGICTKVCPVGDDRVLFASRQTLPIYLKEQAALAADPDHPDYRIWNHFRRWGSWTEEEMKTDG